MNTKKHIYFIPGTAADSKIFERISLPSENFELHFLEWFLPLSKTETIEHYAKRMCDLVTHENPILIGVSFGGIMAQEMAKQLTYNTIVLISSIKNKEELSPKLKFIRAFKLYKLFPSKSISKIERLFVFFSEKKMKSKIATYRYYLPVRNPLFLNWAIKEAVEWKQEKNLNNLIHIHGENDFIFPIKHIQNCISIPKGDHAIILTHYKKINQILSKHL